MATVERVRELNGWKGFAELYKRDGEYMVVSSVDVMFTGPETLVFAADENGNVDDYRELFGARGEESRAVVLAQMKNEEPMR